MTGVGGGSVSSGEMTESAVVRIPSLLLERLPTERGASTLSPPDPRAQVVSWCLPLALICSQLRGSASCTRGLGG